MIKNINEEIIDGLKEAGLDVDNHTIKGVCLFGRRKSLNNRVYQDAAISKLAVLAEGNKCFINHISKSEAKDRDNVRSLRDWVGVYEGARKKKDAIFANLRCREAYWDLLRDLATMQPHGTGFSIDARAKVMLDSKTGLESVVDIERLNSADIVAASATTSTIFESRISEIKDKPVTEADVQEFLKSLGSEGASEIDEQDVFDFMVKTGTPLRTIEQTEEVDNFIKKVRK